MAILNLWTSQTHGSIHGTGIFTYMKTIKNTPNVGKYIYIYKYTIHGGYGKCNLSIHVQSSKHTLFEIHLQTVAVHAFLVAILSKG